MDWGSSDAAEICADTVAISAMSCDETLLLPGIRYRLPTRDGGKSACRHRMLSTRHRRKSMLRHLRTVCGISSYLTWSVGDRQHDSVARSAPGADGQQLGEPSAAEAGQIQCAERESAHTDGAVDLGAVGQDGGHIVRLDLDTGDRAICVCTHPHNGDARDRTTCSAASMRASSSGMTRSPRRPARPGTVAPACRPSVDRGTR